MFEYLKSHPKRNLVFDRSDPAINKNMFQNCDWAEFYRDAEEAIPGNIPVARGKFMSKYCFVNHAGDTKTILSQTGILVFCSIASIIWFRKRQNSVEASTFLSEFTTINNAVEIIEALQYKLHMFGVLIDVSTYIFCDKRLVCVNTTWPDLTLSKKY